MKKKILPAVFVLTFSLNLKSQIFTKVTNTSNPIVFDSPSLNGYTGCAWVDINNDGLLDLFINQYSTIYKNLGGGNFSRILNLIPQFSNSSGNSWADYDNDGFIDCYISSGMPNGSSLFKNNGNETFSKVMSGQIGASATNPSAASAWGDFDNDGKIDLVLATPNGFVGNNVYNKLYNNQGSGVFVNNSTSPITTTLSTFTNPSWCDYDMDGDQDLFFGTGTTNALAPDYLFQNNLYPSSSATFLLLNLPPLSTDNRDGQIWNWIDFDNDRDFDAFVTNYSGGVPNGLKNDFYKNNNGIFVKLDSISVGVIASDIGRSLSSVWMDFDNDGDIDCLVTRENQKNTYYENQLFPSGTAKFLSISNEPMVLNSGNHSGASAGDYDNDGDIDLFLTGTTNATQGLYQNISPSINNWINIKLNGTYSNKSGIGAKILAKSNISGNPIWQLREVSSQNTNYGMNMLNQHFGLGNATNIDTLVVKWPSGINDTCYNITPNNFYSLTEGGCLTQTSLIKNTNPPNIDIELFPNPVENFFSLKIVSEKKQRMTIQLINTQGLLVKEFINEQLYVGSNIFKVNTTELKEGVYICIIRLGGQIKRLKFLKN